MQGMSERESSAHSGLSRGAVQKARKSGRLVLHADGSTDAAASAVKQDRRDFLHRRECQRLRWQLSGRPS
jgi:hypothetical protein